MKSNTELKKLFLATLVAGLSAAFGVSHAALEEVIVTAQKREQSAQDIGITVLSFDEEAIREMQLFEIGDLTERLPGVQAYTSANLPSFTVRGVGLTEFSANFDSPVGVHIDEVYISKPFQMTMGLFDIERVDLLSGPQGTLFGRNTTGGAVNFYTRQPSEEFEANLALTYGKFDRAKVDGVVSGQLADHLLGRLSLSSEQSSKGPYENLFDGEEIGQWDKQQFRAQLDWQRDRLSVDATLTGGVDKSSTTPYKNRLEGQTVDPRDTFTVNQDYYPKNDNKANGINLTVEYDFDQFTLTSITGYNEFDRDQREDSDASPTRSLNLNWFNELESLSQELRFSGDVNNRWNYVAGVYYQGDELLQRDDLAFTPFLPNRLARDYRQEVASIAVFIHNEYAINDTLTANLGLRSTRDETEITGVTFTGDGPVGGLSFDPTTHTLVQERDGEKRTDEESSFKIGLDYAISDDVLVYTNLSTGFRAGGYSVAFGGPFTTFDPEKMNSFEAGVKTRLLSNNLQLNASIYRNDLQDVQVNVDTSLSPIPLTLNAGDSLTTGLEVDLWWSPTDTWDLRAGIAYMDAEFDNSDEQIDGISVQGKRPINTPEYSFNGSVRYQRPLSNNRLLVLSSNLSWTDERFLELTNSDTSLADDYFLLNLRAAVSSQDGRWEFAVWGKNITDEKWVSYVNDLQPFGTVLTVFGEPATYGATYTYNYF